MKIRNWEDVDITLREIAECNIAIKNIENDMNMDINDAKKRAERRALIYENDKKSLEKLLKTFVSKNKKDFKGKSKELNFGKVGYRKTTKVSYPSKETANILEKLKQFEMLDCINVKETVNKEVLRTYTEETINEIGAKLKTPNSYYYESFEEKIKSN